MTDEIPLWEYFDDDVEREPEENSKVEDHIIWHEMGHLIGFAITKEFDIDAFGEITEIKLSDGNEKNPCIYFKSDIYRSNYQCHINNISPGVLEFLYDRRDQERLRKNLNDPYRFLIYSIYESTPKSPFSTKLL